VAKVGTSNPDRTISLKRLQYVIERNINITAPSYEIKLNLLKPSGYFTYHPVSYSKILHGALVAFCVLYGPPNKQKRLSCTSLTDWYFITQAKSVYRAVRTEALYKTD
jgi:hypothetical protein